MTIELSWEVPWAFVNVGLRSYYAEGSKTIAYEIVEQLGWRTPDVVVSPIASGSLFTKLNQAFTELLDLGLADGESPRLVGGQAAGCAPGRNRLRGGGGGAPGAAGDRRPLARDRQSSRRGPRRRDRTRDRRLIHAVPEEDVGECMSLLAETTGVFGETAAGVALGALRQAVAAGQVGPDESVVLLVTGDGLKTPGPVAIPTSRSTSRPTWTQCCSVSRPLPKAIPTKVALLFVVSRR